MPNGATHDALTLAAGALGLPVAFVLAAHSGAEPAQAAQAAGVFSGALLASGMLFSPDLDNNTNNLRRWGALKYLWYPYRALVEHRSWVSHSFLISPAIRLIYFLLVIISIMCIIAAVYGMPPKSVLLAMIAGVEKVTVSHNQLLISFLLGFTAGGDVHVLADKFIHVKKPYKRKMTKI